MQNTEITYIKSDNLLQDTQKIIETARSFAHHTVNIALVQRNWLLGKRIAEEELQGKGRAEYGAEIIKKLSAELTQIYGKGFTKSNLYTFTEFYKTFPNIFQSVIGKSDKSFSLLTWTHYFVTPNSDFTESELEKSIISNLQKFLMELGKGYAFVARQQNIRTEKQDYFIDLVFYNHILNTSFICLQKKNCGPK